MPPLAPPQPLIPAPAHQRLRSDSIDLTCSAGSSSFLGRLWPNRRKFAPASAGAAHEICDVGTPSKFIGFKSEGGSSLLDLINRDNLHCNGESPTEDCDDGQLKNADDLQVLSCDSGMQGKDVRPHEGLFECKNLEDHDAECVNKACRDLLIPVVFEANVEHRGQGSERALQLREVGVSPVMESLKGVALNEQRINNGTEAGTVVKQESRGAATSNVCGVKEEGDQMLMKRLASFKAGEAAGIKKMRMSTLCELQRVAAMLQWGKSMEERWLAADELRRLCKDDPIARVTLGVELGAIPPLISLLHSSHRKHHCTALLALLNLAAGNDVNKGAIVKAKAVPRLMGLLQSVHVEVQTATVTLFLSLSASDGNKAEIGASGLIPVLITLLHRPHTKKDTLRTLYNLSILADNAKFIVEAGGVRILLDIVSDSDNADKSLATLGNLVQTDVGRHAFTEHKEVLYDVLIEVMRCLEMPKCQERAVYVLMVVAYHSRLQREAMVAAGIIPALLELSLLGSPLAQKRAMRTLDSFRRVKAFSAPQQRETLPIFANSADQSNAKTKSEKKVVDGLVRQSLHRTMQRITRRANLSMVLGDAEGTESSAALTTRWSFGRPVVGRRSTLSY